MAVDLEALSNDLDILTAFPLIEENIVATAKWFEGINPIGGVSDGVKRWSTSGYVERYQGSTSSFVPLEWSKVVFGNSFGIVNDANIGLTISLDGSNQTLLDAANGLLLRVNGTDVIKAYASGLAGVNTANPAYAWDVTGDINFTGTLYNNGSAVSLVTQTYVDAADANLQSQITTLGTTDTSLQNQINTLGTTDTSLQTQITTLTSVIAQTSANFRGEWSSATTYQQYDQVLRNGIRYYSQVSSNLNNDPASSPAQWSLFVNVFSGSVGIGTSSPQDLLHIKNSSAGSNAGLRLENADQTWALYCRGFDSDKFKIQDIDANTSPFIIETTAPNNTLYLDSSGNVGIGTSSPNHIVHIKETANSTTTANLILDSIVQYGYEAGTFEVRREDYYVSSFGGVWEDNDNSYARIGIRHSGSTVYPLTIRDNRIGIGTSSPSYLLEVREDGTTTPKVLVRSVSNGDPTISFLSDSKQFTMGIDDTSNAFAISEGSGLGSADRLVIDSSGNVGIGTSSPSAKLTVNKGNDIGFIVQDNTTDNHRLHMMTSASDNGYYIGYASGQIEGYKLNSSGDSYFLGGNVGIGTSSPAYELDVRGNATSDHGQISLGNSDASKFLMSISGHSADNPAIFWENSQDLRFATASNPSGSSFTERMRIDSSGKVGIGTSSPDEKLHVEVTATNTAAKFSASGGGDSAAITPLAAGNGAIYGVLNDALTDYEPLFLYGETIGFRYRTGVGTVGAAADIGTNGDLTVHQNLVIGTSGKGIDFSATSGTGTSELLDDYEEGTWTPAYGTSATQFDLVSYDAGRGGRYTKIGNLVHIQGYIETDSITKGSASGDIRITGLPFAANGSSDFSGRAAVKLSSAYGFLDDVPCGGIIYNGEAYIALTFRNASDGSESPLQVSDLDTGSNKNILIFSATYTI